MNKKLIIFGTRPEFIKLLPVISEIKNRGLEDCFDFVFTCQHADLVIELFDLFSFKPTYIFPIKDCNSLAHSFSDILEGIQNIIDDLKKEYVIKAIIGQGDTTTCACAAMCAFFNHIPFAHIEAGLRTNDFFNPFPEEFFRKTITLTTSIHFAPTLKAQENLLSEGVSVDNIILTGNPIVDAIELINNRVSDSECNFDRVKQFNKKNNVLITCHRRENHVYKFKILIETIKVLAEENPEINFIWISHMNPSVHRELSGACFSNYSNIYVLQPLSVIDLFHLYSQILFIITDSGGIQEEAPSFNIPVIIIREKTERNESVDLGYSVLIKHNKEELISAFNAFKKLKSVEMINPYGDGNAAPKIVSRLIDM